MRATNAAFRPRTCVALADHEAQGRVDEGLLGLHACRKQKARLRRWRWRTARAAAALPRMVGCVSVNTHQVDITHT